VDVAPGVGDEVEAGPAAPSGELGGQRGHVDAGLVSGLLGSGQGHLLRLDLVGREPRVVGLVGALDVSEAVEELLRGVGLVGGAADDARQAGDLGVDLDGGGGGDVHGVSLAGGPGRSP
jgi:hypothetical protein